LNGLFWNRTLLVLPKWTASPALANSRWAGEVRRLRSFGAGRIARLIVPAAWIRTGPEAPAWQPNRFGLVPTIAKPQLLVAKDVTPIIAAEDGILLGEYVYGDIIYWILADPDLLSNHGLRRGDNGPLAVAMVEAMLGTSGDIVVDEVIHGFRLEPNVWRLLFEFPFVFVTLNALVVTIMLLWAAAGRFGAPLRDVPPHKAGKLTLIGNAAALLAEGRHGGEIVRRYRAVIVGSVGRGVHAPAAGDDAELRAHLERVGAARGVGSAIGPLWRDIETAAAGGQDGSRLLAAARRLNAWKKEMLHGPGGDTLARRAAEGRNAQGGHRPGRRR